MKMEITTKQKVLILEAAKNLVVNGYENYKGDIVKVGLCIAIRKSLLPILELYQLNALLGKGVVEIFGLENHKPDNLHSSYEHWFLLNDYGTKQRVKILNERIYFYQKQIYT